MFHLITSLVNLQDWATSVKQTSPNPAEIRKGPVLLGNCFQPGVLDDAFDILRRRVDKNAGNSYIHWKTATSSRLEIAISQGKLIRYFCQWSWLKEKISN